VGFIIEKPQKSDVSRHTPFAFFNYRSQSNVKIFYIHIKIE